MTGRANSLTKRVTAATDPQSMWSAPAGDLRCMLEAMQRIGYDIEPLVKAAGLGDVDLCDPDVRISCVAYGELLTQAQRTRFTPNLSLELAKVTPIGAYPLLDYLVLTSDTVANGYRQLARYVHLIGGPVRLEFHEAADRIRIEMPGAPAAFSVEFSASLMVLHMKAETDGRFQALAVSFRHVPDDAAAFERVLGCPVNVSADWNGVSVSPDAWSLPLRRRDPILRKMLEAQAEPIMQRLPERTGLAHEVQRVLTMRVAGGDTRIDAVARELAMSGRTLQRRLKGEGVSYQELLEDSRKETAGRCISESTLAIGEIAYLLGYSEPASFHRAFKRWFDVTPDVFRRAQRTGS